MLGKLSVWNPDSRGYVYAHPPPAPQPPLPGRPGMFGPRIHLFKSCDLTPPSLFLFRGVRTFPTAPRAPSSVPSVQWHCHSMGGAVRAHVRPRFPILVHPQCSLHQPLLRPCPAGGTSVAVIPSVTTAGDG